MCCRAQDVRRGAGEPWEPCDWRQLSSDIRVAQQRRLHPERWQLRLRAPVEQLHAWWKQRLEVSAANLHTRI